MTTIQASLWLVILLVGLALAFDFMNGFHDAANSIATVVSTGVLKPAHAVLFAAFFNLIAIGVFHLSVAATVGKGIVEPGVVDVHVVFGALLGAITWNLVTWYLGLPSSSSHALIGGILGSAVFASGWGVVNWEGLKDKVLIPSLLAPFLGVATAFALMLGILWLIRRRTPEGTFERRLPADEPDPEGQDR